MADGDLASSIGLAVMNGLEKVYLLWQQINKTRDMIADHRINGTHAADKITTGTFAEARIPVITDASKIPNLNASKITAGTLDQARIPTGIPPTKIADSANLLLDTHVVRGQQVISLTDFDAIGTLNAAAAPGTGLGSWVSAVLSPSGKLGIAVSSMRFKKNVKPSPRRLTLLQAQIINWVYKVTVDRSGDTHRGLSAEQLHELGLHEYVVYDPAGDPLSIRYELLVVDLLDIAQDHEERLRKLEEGKS